MLANQQETSKDELHIEYQIRLSRSWKPVMSTHPLRNRSSYSNIQSNNIYKHSKFLSRYTIINLQYGVEMRTACYFLYYNSEKRNAIQAMRAILKYNKAEKSCLSSTILTSVIVVNPNFGKHCVVLNFGFTQRRAVVR